ncbi:MAG: hypothetical protein J0M24_19810 [Verrucomicrobia bacterium]|nr:hypothetical protein [Verrucomicrobiota bacterium]
MNHFPLALLACGESIDARGDMIVAWSNHSAGEAALEKMEDEPNLSGHPGYEQFTADELKKYGAKEWILGRSGRTHFSNFRHHSEALRQAQEQVRRVQAAATTTSPLVRIDDGILADSFGWCGRTPKLDYRELAVLMAVYSLIGSKAVDHSRRDQILLRCQGYWQEAQANKLAPKRADGWLPPTLSQLRYTLDRLESRSLLARLQADRRTVYFSRVCDYTAMAKDVAAVHSARPKQVAARKAAESELKGLLGQKPQ